MQKPDQTSRQDFVLAVRDEDALRCCCGSLLARLVPAGVELKCRRCKRKLIVAVPAGADIVSDATPLSAGLKSGNPVPFTICGPMSLLSVMSPAVAVAHIYLARAYTATGDKAGAKAAYEEALRIWKDADADLPLLVEAKAEYSKLAAS